MEVTWEVYRLTVRSISALWFGFRFSHSFGSSFGDGNGSSEGRCHEGEKSESELHVDFVVEDIVNWVEVVS